MAFPQSLNAAEPEAYALKGTIGSLDTLAGGDTTWNAGTTTGTIKIKLTKPAGGAAFSAYKLLNITNDIGVLKVSVPDNAQEFWKAYLGISETVTVSKIKEHIKPMSETQASNSIVTSFKDYANKDNLEKSTVDVGVTGESADIFTGFGFYIIQQTQAPDGGYIASAPVRACLPMQKGASWISSYTAIPKDSKITLSKMVQAPNDTGYIKETVAEIGETLKYKITADIAKYGSDIGTITYDLVDELPTGIEYVNNTAEVKFYNTGVEVPKTGYTVYYDSGARTLTLNLGTDYATYPADCDKVEITYDAVLKDNAVVETTGNENNVELTYTSAKGVTKTLNASAKAYTLELDITKVDKDDSTPLAGAVFQVYRSEADANNSTNAIEFVDISSPDEKIYRVATAGETGTTDIVEVSAEDATKGEIKILGLNDVTYYFKETVAPTGYNLPDSLFGISPAPTEAEKSEVDGQTIYKSMTAQSADIQNDSGINLPVTGGMGTVIFTAIGLLLMAGAAYFLFGKKKRSE